MLSEKSRLKVLNNFEIYRLAKQLAIELYEIADKLPDSEKYGLVSQLRRAAISIGANIAESQGRKTHPDQNHFTDIARGSITEVVFYLDFFVTKGWLPESDIVKILEKVQVLEVKMYNFSANKQRPIRNY